MCLSPQDGSIFSRSHIEGIEYRERSAWRCLHNASSLFIVWTEQRAIFHLSPTLAPYSLQIHTEVLLSLSTKAAVIVPRFPQQFVSWGNKWVFTLIVSLSMICMHSIVHQVSQYHLYLCVCMNLNRVSSFITTLLATSCTVSLKVFTYNVWFMIQQLFKLTISSCIKTVKVTPVHKMYSVHQEEVLWGTITWHVFPCSHIFTKIFLADCDICTK